MNEKEIRLDQTRKVFDMLALLIKNNETCSYRYLIYDMLGFKEENYAELISGMAITNKLVECETQKIVLDKIKEKVKELDRFDPCGSMAVSMSISQFQEDLEILLEEIE